MNPLPHLDTLLTQTTLHARREERERLARELHDTLLQSATGVILMVQSLLAALPQRCALREEMERALDQADRLLDEARDRIVDLRAPAPSLSFEELLGQLIGSARSPFSAVCELCVRGPSRPLRFDVARSMLSIASEALANAIAHAEATRIEVAVMFGRRRIRLRVRDDGCGMTARRAAIARGGHFGLCGMQERAREMQGRLSIFSEPGAGTEVLLCVPASHACLDAEASPPERLVRRPRLRRRSDAAALSTPLG